MTYPDGEIVTHNYNNRMLLNSLIGASTYVSSTTYDAAGRIDLRTFGNSTQTDYMYHPWTSQGGRLQKILSGTAASPSSLQSLEYAYDAGGNVDWIKDWKAGPPQLQDFGYDALDRLTSAVVNTGSNGLYDETYAYDEATGNLINKGGLTLQYNNAAHVHAVTNAGSNTYGYDANGNMTSRLVSGQSFGLSYDAENRLVSVSGSGATSTPTPLPTSTSTPTPTPTTVPGNVIPQSGWTLRYVDSQETVGEDGAAANAFDGDPLSLWHTRWYQATDPLPHEIQIDLGASYSLTGFKYLPRQDGFPHGRIGQYEFYVSTDGTNWGTAVAAGTFGNDALEKTVGFPAATGRYIRLRALTEAEGGPWTSAGEINVLGTAAGNTPTPTPTSALPTATNTLTPTSALPTATNTPTPTPASAATRVAYWKLEEKVSPWSDATGRGHSLARVAGSVTSITARVGKGLNNASNTTDLQTSSHSDFDFTRTQGFSIEAWARTSNNDDNWKMLFGRRGPAGGAVVQAGHWQGEMGFGVRTSTGQAAEAWYTPAQPINDGQWHHWVFTLDATHISIWMDGQKVSTAPHNLTSGEFSASTPFYLLRDTNEVNRWLGDVDEFAVYKGVLSQAEIVDHYNNGAGKYYASAPEAPVSGYKTVSYSPPTTALLEAEQSPLMQTSTIASFTYDGDGRQVKAVVGGVTTYYVGAHYQVDNGVVTKYYFAGAQRVAMRKNGTLYYLLADHLGSTSLTTDTSGAPVSELRYKAWGETRYSSGTTPTSYRYTGQREEPGIGLMFYNARWYDPYITQFSQPDSIIPDPYNSQDWNRYSYARNNPLSYTDPSGHSVDCAIGEYRCRAGKLIPRARIFYLNGLGGEGNEDLLPELNKDNEYESTMFWISQTFGNDSLTHIALFTNPHVTGLSHAEMFGEALGIRNEWTGKALEAITSELENNPLKDDEILVIVGTSAGGTVAAELLDDLGREGIFVDEMILRGSPVIELSLTNVGSVDYIASENPLTDWKYYSVDVNPFDAVQVQEHRLSGLIGHVPHGEEMMNKIGSLIVDLIVSGR